MDQEETTIFKDTVQKYLMLDAEIKTLEKALKDRKEKKKNYSETIMTFLQEQDISHINLQGDYNGKSMLLDTRTTKQKLITTKAREIILSYFDNQEEALKLLDKIVEQETSKEVSKLKINKKMIDIEALEEAIDEIPT